MAWQVLAGAAAGALSNIFGAAARNRQMRSQVKQINRNLTQGAANLQHAAASSGVDIQHAVNFASNFLRKHSNNPQAAEVAVSMSQNRISDAANRSAQLRTGAQELLTRRLAMPKRSGLLDFLSEGTSGLFSGAAFGASLIPSKKTT